MLRRTPLRRLLSTTIPNTGSVARDQLANERTCLAFLRTGMTFVGAGVALWTAYCFAYDASVPTSVHPSRMIPAVLGFTVNGALFAAYAMRRFFTIQRLLEEGKFKLAKYDLLFVLFSTFAITCGVMAYVFKVEMEAKPGSQDVLKDVLNVRRHHSAAEKEKERGKKL